MANGFDAAHRYGKNEGLSMSMPQVEATAKPAKAATPDNIEDQRASLEARQSRHQRNDGLGNAMGNLGPREAQLRALKEARYEERQQRLRQLPQPGSPVPPPDKPMANNMANTSHMANRDMANRSMKPRSLAAGATTYRYRNADQRRTYMRNLMRTIRAKQKEAHA
jgi:hypothetical protein